MRSPERGEGLHEFFRCRVNPGLTLYGLHHDCRGFLRDGLPYCIRIIERHEKMIVDQVECNLAAAHGPFDEAFYKEAGIIQHEPVTGQGRQDLKGFERVGGGGRVIRRLLGDHKIIPQE